MGEGPGFNEDREGRPFVGRAGGLLVRLLGADRLAARGRVHHQRGEVPPARQPRPAARRDRRLRRRSCAASSRCWTRRSSSRWAATRWARSCPGPASARSTAPRVAGRPGDRRPRRPRRSRCTTRPRPCAPPAIERESFEDMARVPAVLLRARDRCAPVTARHRDGGARTRHHRRQPRPRPPRPPRRRHRACTRRVPAHGRRSRGRRRRPAHPVLTPQQIETTMADPNIAAPHHPARRGGGDRQEHVRVRVRRRHRRHRLRPHVPRRGDVRHRPRRPRRHLPQGEPRTRSGRS